ncbi:hypothetical protein Hanom_Chr05g00404771 [Helianthus anomalus]
MRFARMLPNSRARKSPHAHAPLHTSEHTCVLHACSPIYEHVSRHTRMLRYIRASTHALARILLYIRTHKLPCAHAPLLMNT